MSADVTVRVGAFTIPVYVTGNLQGLIDGEEIGLADIAALKAGSEDSILVDAGGSLQGTARASLTGGMDMTSAFAAAGYDLQAFDASDMAYGTDLPSQRCNDRHWAFDCFQPVHDRKRSVAGPFHQLEPQPHFQRHEHHCGGSR